MGPSSPKRRNCPAAPLTVPLRKPRSPALTGFDLYQTRLDKGYSLTDCISMETMRHQGISDALPNDAHFEQEGFRAIFRQSERQVEQH